MPVRSASESCHKAAISVSEMCRLCSLSRSRFYELVEACIMPQPCYDLRTRRPLYPRELQEACLRVKATNMGIDGQYVLFYARKVSIETTPNRTSRRDNTARPARHAELLDGLRALGLSSVTDAQVDAAVRQLFPGGHGGMDEGDVLRLLWRHLRGMSTA